MGPYPTERTGAILIVALWIIALLAMLSMGLTMRLRLGIRQEKWTAVEMESREFLLSLGGLAVEGFAADTDLSNDSSLDSWGRRYDAGGPSMLASFGEARPGNWDVSFTIVPEDEAGKVNINFASQRLLAETLKEAGVSTGAKQLASAIVDWRDPDQLGAAESDLYLTFTPPYTAADRDFARIEELRYVAGVDGPLFFGEDANHSGLLDREEDDGDLFLPLDNGDGRLQPGLAALFTVFGDGSINVNGAPEAVLRAGFRSALEAAEGESLAASLVARRRGRDGLDGTDDDRPFRDEGELAEFVGETVYARCIESGIEFGVTTNAVRFHLEVRMPSSGYQARADVLVLREGDEISVAEWHDG